MSLRLWLLGGAAVVAAIAGTAMWRGGATSGDATTYTTTKLERGDIVARVTATGTLSALVTVQVGAQVSGRIAEINADYNAPVKKGQVIARLDPQLFRAAVEQAKANLATAQANLAKAKVQAADAERQATRAEDLYAQKLVAASDRDTARANAEAAHAATRAADAEVQQASAALHQAEINLTYTTITAPTDGVVISRSVDVGQTVAATLQAPTLFTIAQDLRQMQVDTNVAESDVGRLQERMNATFTVDAYPGERFKGAVRQIRNAPQTVQNVVTYDAVIDVDNSDLRLKPGMTANVIFVYAERDAVLRAPNAALRFHPPDAAAKNEGGGKRERGERTLWVLRDNQPRAVPVTVGVSDGATTEVASENLHEGDAVIVDAAAKKPAQPMGRLF